MARTTRMVLLASTAERLEISMCLDWIMSAAVRTIAISGLRQRFGKMDEKRERRLLADILLGEELAAKVYGPLPELEQSNHE
jgi:hypothetical protein